MNYAYKGAIIIITPVIRVKDVCYNYFESWRNEEEREERRIQFPRNM